MSDSSRAFFDSLAAERRRDTARTSRPPLTRQLTSVDTLAAVAWLDVLRDTALVRLVDLALRQNRNLQLAVARVREFRANVGSARAPQVPSVTLNGSESTN